MSPPRVLLAIGSLAAGGSERQVLGILKHLDRARYQPELYVVYAGGELRDEVPPDVPVHVFTERCGPLRRGFPGAIHRARVRDYAAVLAERDIDLTYDRTFHMTLSAAGAVVRRPTPRISVIVSDPQSDFETSRERYAPVKRLLLKRAYRRADVVAAVSEGVRRRAIDYYGLPPEKVETLANFFDVERIERMAQCDPPPELARREGRFRIVAVGRLTEAKGYDVLLDALRLVHDRGQGAVELILVGAGPLEDELRRRIQAASLADHVVLAGFQRNPLPLMRTADLFCLASIYEGMPNVLVEAMLCGVPILATDCESGPREILEGGRFGRLVPPRDPEPLADAICDAVVDYPAWSSRTPEARDHARREYSPETGINHLMHVFDRTIQRYQEQRHRS
jgi:glycosyltransferase involved in cell wall biosynthesis